MYGVTYMCTHQTTFECYTKKLECQRLRQTTRRERPIPVPHSPVEDLLDAQRPARAVALDVPVRVGADGAKFLHIGICVRDNGLLRVASGSGCGNAAYMYQMTRS